MAVLETLLGEHKIYGRYLFIISLRAYMHGWSIVYHRLKRWVKIDNELFMIIVHKSVFWYASFTKKTGGGHVLIAKGGPTKYFVNARWSGA